jgi:soluble lytic murein transglycosylase-like protein
MEGGDNEGGRAELGRLATGYPLTYYGWRAQERLALEGGMLVQTDASLAEGTRRIDDVDIERVALLIEADLDDLARDELRFAARRARGYGDRTRLGVLLARVGDYHRANQLVVSFSDGSAVDPELVWAIMREESHYRVDARSAVGALGLLQLMPSTAKQLAREQGLASFETGHLFDPRTNITLGASYLAQLGRRFDGRMSAAIGSYNAGPRKVAGWLKGEGGRLDDDVWVESIPYDQTRSYVKRVLRSLHVYRSFYR